MTDAWSRFAGASGAVVFSATALLSGVALAQDAAVSPEIAARMEKEKAARQACKIDICKAFAQPAAGPAITCAVTKTWLAPEIQTAILGNRMSWPWGHAQCTANIDLDRAAIAAARNDANATIKLKSHDVSCTLDSKDAKDGTAYSVKLSIQPTVTFENGTAKKVDMGWGPVEAPVLAKTAIWSATAVDSSFSVIANGVVNEINSFMFEKCKDEGITIAKK